MATGQTAALELSDNKSDESGKSQCSFCKSVAASGVKCATCNKMYHNSCATRVVGLEITGRGIVECCKKTSAILNSQDQSLPTETYGEGQVEIFYLKQVLDEKNTVINELRNIIKYQEQVIQLLTEKKDDKNQSDVNKNLLIEKNADKRNGSSQDTKYSKQVQKKVQQETNYNTNGNTSLLEKVQTNIMQDIINLTNDIPSTSDSLNLPNKSLHKSSNEDGFTDVAYRRKRTAQKSNIPTTKFASGQIEGKSEKIVGAVRRKYIYVGRITGRDVTEEDMKEYLKDLKNFKQYELISVKKLNTLGNNSAFCIGLPNDELFHKVFDVQYWRTGVSLREFDLRRTFLAQRQQAKLDIQTSQK